MASPAATRARPPPPPLRLQKSPYRRSSSNADNQLLYDLPSASSIGTPPPDIEHISLNSPTSSRPPSRPPSRIHPANKVARALSPPSRSNHGRASPMPNNIDAELEQFALNCRSWYYDQNEEAGRQMTQTLTNLPPHVRANYARIQAHIRSSFHTFLAARRKAEFQAHLSSTAPGGSLPAHCRSNPSGTAARQERMERFDRFVKTWCNAGMPGTRPFFESLWAVMRLQVIPENLGGAGGRLIEWEFDDAVFMESAGKEFMIEAIDVLKGVLGFEELLSSRSSVFRASDDANVSPPHTRSQSEPVSSLLLAPSNSQKSAKSARNIHSGRSRAPSDPFVDSNTTTSNSPRDDSSSFWDPKNDTGTTRHRVETSGTPSPPTGEQIDALLVRTAGGERTYAPSLTSENFDGGAFMRTWTAPDLSNPEFMSLTSCFPTLLTRRSLPRFPAEKGKRHSAAEADLEAGDTDVEVRCEIRIGTGVIYLGTQRRTGAWRGSWWERFKSWWKRLLW